MSKKVAISPWMLLLVLLTGIAAFAQTTASIIGTVTDPTGAAVVSEVLTRTPVPAEDIARAAG